MAPTADDERIARDLTDRLVAAFGNCRVVWFGSRSQGKAQPDSDWDVLVVADAAGSLGERLFRARKATRDVRVAKDILVLTPTEYAEYALRPSSVVAAAERDGRVMHEVAA